MKNSKKFLSLVLAMVMAFALLAVPAMAYDEGHEHECAVCSDEGIMPRTKMGTCPVCHGGTYIYEYTDSNGQKHVDIYCMNNCGYEAHK